MEGYHGTVFAYGMTGTGKTFSMQGTATSPGVIPRAITDIFSFIRETPHREFLLRVSYLEIYNERMYDLLSPSSSTSQSGQAAPQEEIKLREDSKRGVYATPLKEEIVQSPTQLLRVIARGDNVRRTGTTQYNVRSSRSHAVVQIVVESRERGPASAGGMVVESKRHATIAGGVRVSTLSLIDLAGSERAAESKERRTEGAHINKSLLTLGTVIARLSGDKEKSGAAGDKEKHLPYRDSKLTRLLQPALSGNSLVSILCTIQVGAVGSVATAMNHVGETLNTLKFASRAKNNIVSHAKKAEESAGTGIDAGSRALLDRYRVEIQDLRKQLDAQSKSKADEDERARELEAEQQHEERMLEMQLARTALKERIEHLNRLILCSKSIGVNAQRSFSSLSLQQQNRTSLTSNGKSATTPGTPGSSAIASGEAGSSELQHSRSLRSNSSQTTIEQTPSMGTGPTGPRKDYTGAPSHSHPDIAALHGTGATASGALGGGGGDPVSDEEDSMGENGDGTASAQAQVQALQSDLADKNRYICTLEKRLLQARRSSHSRISMNLTTSSPSSSAAAAAAVHKLPGLSGSDARDEADASPVAGGLGGTISSATVETLLREKDDEIAELRARIEDKDRMVAALRSAARKRETAAADHPLDGQPAASGSARESAAITDRADTKAASTTNETRTTSTTTIITTTTAPPPPTPPPPTPPPPPPSIASTATTAERPRADDRVNGLKLSHPAGERRVGHHRHRHHRHSSGSGSGHLAALVKRSGGTDLSTGGGSTRSGSTGATKRPSSYSTASPPAPPPHGRASTDHKSISSSAGSSGLRVAPISPVALLSPSALASPEKKRAKNAGVDEMTRILDEMIRDRVDSGHLTLRTGKAGLEDRVASLP